VSPRDPLVPDDEPWTLEEGARDVARFVGRRSPGAVLYWVPMAFGFAWFCRLGGGAGEVSAFAFMMAFAALVLAAPVGLILARGLVDHVRFGGWVPWALPSAASVLVVVAGLGGAALVLPFPSAFFASLVATMASIGAVAAVTRQTWAET
jgi:hypothetical protein